MTDILVVALALTLSLPPCLMEGGNVRGDNTTTASPSTFATSSGKPVTFLGGQPYGTTVVSMETTSLPVLYSSTLSSTLPSTTVSTPSPTVPLSPASNGSSTPSSSPTPVSLSTTKMNVGPALLAAQVHDSTNTVNFRHRHHPNHPWGPHFEENVVNVTVREFQNVHLDCHVALIEDKLVSWVRRKTDQLELLTLGITNHSSDPRFTSDFRYPNNWRLGIRNATRNDSGIYLCQISTHPPKVLEVQLTVEAHEVFVISSRGERVQDVYYKEGSTLQLICEVTNIKSRYVNWYHNAALLNHDITRGGVSIKTEIVGDHAKSILLLARITRKDIGTYLCTAPPQNGSVTVHVLNGENPAELYLNEAPTFRSSWSVHIAVVVLLQLVVGSVFNQDDHTI